MRSIDTGWLHKEFFKGPLQDILPPKFSGCRWQTPRHSRRNQIFFLFGLYAWNRQSSAVADGKRRDTAGEIGYSFFLGCMHGTAKVQRLPIANAETQPPKSDILPFGGCVHCTIFFRICRRVFRSSGQLHRKRVPPRKWISSPLRIHSAARGRIRKSSSARQSIPRLRRFSRQRTAPAPAKISSSKSGNANRKCGECSPQASSHIGKMQKIITATAKAKDNTATDIRRILRSSTAPRIILQYTRNPAAAVNRGNPSKRSSTEAVK